MRIVSFSFLLIITGCFDPKPTHTLWVKSLRGEKEKIADFYQSHEGGNDCEAVRKRWTENYQPWCEAH